MRKHGLARAGNMISVCVHTCMCVCEREREREMRVLARMCVCVHQSKHVLHKSVLYVPLLHPLLHHFELYQIFMMFSTWGQSAIFTGQVNKHCRTMATCWKAPSWRVGLSRWEWIRASLINKNTMFTLDVTESLEISPLSLLTWHRQTISRVCHDMKSGGSTTKVEWESENIFSGDFLCHIIFLGRRKTKLLGPRIKKHSLDLSTCLHTFSSEKKLIHGYVPCISSSDEVGTCEWIRVLWTF